MRGQARDTQRSAITAPTIAYVQAAAARDAERAVLLVDHHGDAVAALILVGKIAIDHRFAILAAAAGPFDQTAADLWRALLVDSFVTRFHEILPHLADAPGLNITQ